MKARIGNPPVFIRITKKSTAKSVATNIKVKQKQQEKKVLREQK